MNYSVKVWLSKRWWIQVLVKWWRGSECGHIDSCGLECNRMAIRHIEDRPWMFIFLKGD